MVPPTMRSILAILDQSMIGVIDAIIITLNVGNLIRAGDYHPIISIATPIDNCGITALIDRVIATRNDRGLDCFTCRNLIGMGGKP
jgi:hypothetical protein